MLEYLILFAWSILSASAIPVSSEPYFVGIIYAKKSLLFPVMVATTGNIIGGLTTFWLGYKGGKLVEKRLSGEKKANYDRALRITQKYGPIAMLISWVPVLGDIVIIIGGVLRLPVARSIFWMSLGKFARYLLLGLITLGIIR